VRGAQKRGLGDACQRTAAVPVFPEFYKVDADAITTKVKQEFAAKYKAESIKQATPNPPAKALKKTRAALFQSIFWRNLHPTGSAFLCTFAHLSTLA